MKKANSWLASFGPQYKETCSFGFAARKGFSDYK